MKNPLISVVMPIYNSESYLDEAISSITNQSFRNFELLAINDASSDNSLSIIKKHAKNDSRIIIINNDKNIGFVKSLNIGIDAAKGKYIARMDSDDKSAKDRFSKQVEILEKRNEIGVVGSWVIEMGSKKVFKYPIKHTGIYKFLLVGSPFGHPAAMIRKSVLDENKIYYNPQYTVAQDYELWSRILEVTKGYNIPEGLLYWRKHENQRSETKKIEKFENTFKISQRIFNTRFPDLKMKTEYLKNILLRKKERSIEDLNNSIEFFDKITDDVSRKEDIYLYNKFARKVYLYLRNNVDLGYSAYKILKKSKWKFITKENRFSEIKFLILSLLHSIKRLKK